MPVPSRSRLAGSGTCESSPSPNDVNMSSRPPAAGSPGALQTNRIRHASAEITCIENVDGRSWRRAVADIDVVDVAAACRVKHTRIGIQPRRSGPSSRSECRSPGTTGPRRVRIAIAPSRCSRPDRALRVCRAGRRRIGDVEVDERRHRIAADRHRAKSREGGHLRERLRLGPIRVAVIVTLNSTEDLVECQADFVVGIVEVEKGKPSASGVW